MAWVALTVEDLKERAPDSEIARIESAGESDGIADNNKVQGCLDQTMEMVRGYVGACDKNLPLPDCLKIPGECRLAAISIARHLIVTSVPGFGEPHGPDRVREYDDAMRFLREDVAECRIAIIPDSEGEVTQPTQSSFCGGSDPQLDFAR